MGIIPAITNETSAPNPSELGKVSQYIKHHEKLIVIVLFCAVGVFAWQKAAGLIERHDQRVVDLAHATLASQVDTVKAQASTNAAAAQQYQQLATQLAQSNAALTAVIATRNATTVKQQAIDKQLPPDQLVARWEALTNTPKGLLVPTPTGVNATTAAAQETVAQLERIPQLDGNLADTNGLLENEQKQFGSLAGLNVGLNKQIDGLNIELVDQAKACTDDKNLLIAKARKSKLKWFGAGFVAGIATRLFFKF